jgi:TIR domain/CHAT domain
MSIDTPMTRILILASNPKNTNKLRLDEEVREIMEGLKRSKSREQFTIESRWAVRPDNIRRAILDFEPQIIHFSGHGETEGQLILEDVAGNAKPVSSEALVGLFELFADQVKCVLLNACYSHKQADAIAEHIDFVIGMKQAIGDKAAIKYAIGFYDALGAGRTIEIAHKFGVNAIQLEGIEEEETPTIKKKLYTNLANITFNNPNNLTTFDTKLVDQNNKTVEVFFSYSHQDEKLRDELEKHLSLLKRQGVITGWHDRQISAGKEWSHEIDSHLDTAKVILLLVSSAFIASNYCWDVEVTRAMERHEKREARVIPIILKPVDWKSAPFAKLQALPKDAKAVTKWGNRDEAFVSITQGIRAAIKDLR